jgi:hypothetical protein
MFFVATILAIGVLGCSAILLSSRLKLNRISHELQTLIDSSGKPLNNKSKGFKKIKEMHSGLNTEASLQLFHEAEKTFRIFVLTMRFLVFFVVTLPIAASFI